MADRTRPLRRLQLHGRASTARESRSAASPTSRASAPRSTIAEYRNGNEKENHVRKVPGIAQGRRRHAQARHHQLEDAVGLDQGDAHHRSSGAADRHHHAARRGAGTRSSRWMLRSVRADEIHRPDAGRQGRRRRGDGGARAVGAGAGSRGLTPQLGATFLEGTANRMTIGLVFQTAAPAGRSRRRNRTDIACFIGFVGRRIGAPLPDTVRAELKAAGWIDGPWRAQRGGAGVGVAAADCGRELGCVRRALRLG